MKDASLLELNARRLAEYLGLIFVCLWQSMYLISLGKNPDQSTLSTWSYWQERLNRQELQRSTTTV